MNARPTVTGIPKPTVNAPDPEEQEWLRTGPTIAAANIALSTEKTNTVPRTVMLDDAAIVGRARGNQFLMFVSPAIANARRPRGSLRQAVHTDQSATAPIAAPRTPYRPVASQPARRSHRR